jgi:hypothetical protein
MKTLFLILSLGFVTAVSALADPTKLTYVRRVIRDQPGGKGASMVVTIATFVSCTKSCLL